MTKPYTEADHARVRRHYAEARLEDWNYGSLIRLRDRLDRELHSRTLREIAELETRANDLRESLGLRRRRPLKTERPVK